MLQDSYVEQIIDAKTPDIFFARLGLSVTLIVSGIFLVVQTPIVGLAFVLMGMIFFNMVKDERKVEYEYTLSNTHVEVAIIYNKAKRHELMGFDLDLISVIVPGTSKRFEGMDKLRKHDYTSGYKEGETILVFYEDKKMGKKHLFELEPNEEVMNHIKQFARNKMSEF